MKNLLEKYAKVIVEKGAAVQKGQIVHITSDIENIELVRLITKFAYESNAKSVMVDYQDEQIRREYFLKSFDEVFDELPAWRKAKADWMADEKVTMIYITSEDPDGMNGIDPDRIMRLSRASKVPMEKLRDVMGKMEMQTCVVAAASTKWAKKVYPELSEQEAVDTLWKDIFSFCRIDKEDPVKEWDKHLSNLNKSSEYLNEQNFEKLHFTNSLGTDLTIELPEGHIFARGDAKSKDGVCFVANMPTEEVFTMPKYDGVNGKVYSSLPLNYNGNLIDEFYMIFKDGKVVESNAKKGNDNLTKLLDTDEGSRYLGEVAIVPYSSPIAKANKVYYNTLFDENASCHLALGSSYQETLKGGTEMTKEEIKKHGGNDSVIHEDFMFGTSDLKIVGLKKDGSQITFYENGEFIF